MKNNYFKQLQELLPQAYCVYSNFHVAAILETDKGDFKGINIENSAYPNSICAERCALFNAILHGARKVYAVHLMTDDATGKANMCGACRQSLGDHILEDTQVYVYDHQGNFTKFKFLDLLPELFGNKYLKIG